MSDDPVDVPLEVGPLLAELGFLREALARWVRAEQAFQATYKFEDEYVEVEKEWRDAWAALAWIALGETDD